MADSTSFMRYGEFSHATLRVPSSQLTTYRTTPYWDHFPQIIAWGDINNDDRTTIDDVTTLIDHLLAGDTSTIQIADLNDDATLTIADITTLIDHLLTQ